MKKVIITEVEKETILLDHIEETEPIFLVRNGMVTGLLVKEIDKGWIIRVGGACGSTGFYKTRKEAMLRNLDCQPNSEFYIKPEIKQNEKV